MTPSVSASDGAVDRCGRPVASRATVGGGATRGGRVRGGGGAVEGAVGAAWLYSSANGTSWVGSAGRSGSRVAAGEPARGSGGTLDLALGLGVVRLAVLRVMPRAASSCSRALAGTTAASRVVNTRPLSVRVAAWAPCAAHAARNAATTSCAGHGRVGGQRQDVPGVVVDPGQDLRVPPAGQRVVGEVGLPQLVRLLGREPGPRRPGPLAGLRGHQPGPAPGPVHRRRGDLQPVMGLQVPGDRVRARVQPRPVQLLPQPAISSAASGPIAHGDEAGRRDRGSNAASPSRLVPGQQLVDPGPGHLVLAGDLPDRALLDNDGGDTRRAFDIPAASGHARPQPPATRHTCPLCLETPVLDVLKQDSAARRPELHTLTSERRPAATEAARGARVADANAPGRLRPRGCQVGDAGMDGGAR